MKDVVRVLCLCLVMLISSRGAASADVVGAGYEHSVYLSSTGHVWTWGRNWYGQLGIGPTGNHATPVQVSISNVIAIAVGGYHTCVLKSDGTVWCWGENWGKLGDGTQTNRDQPVRAGTLTNIVAIAAGATQSLAVDSSGTVWAWGENIYGDLGEGTGNEYDSPVALTTFSGPSVLAGGAYHTLAIQPTGGYVWSTGWNGFGQLGRSPGSASFALMGVVSGVGAIAGGYDFSLMLLTDHTLYGVGNNTYGELGNGQFASSSTPSSITMPDDVGMISAGYRHSLAVTTNGTLYAWGLNDWGQLGVGNNTNQGSPTAVTGVGTYAVVSIAGGAAHSVALTSDGTVWAWGLNNYGQLGDGTTTASNSPVTVSAPLGGW